MSFILDALKKSETDRQQRGSAEFASVPSSGGRREGPPAWLWIVGVLLLVNLAVLVGLFLRPEASTVQPVTRPAASTAVTADDAAPPARNRENFASQVATARENAPPREEPAEAEPADAEPITPPPPQPRPSVTVAREPVSAAALPSIFELQANGELALPDLHVDIHVYSESPKDRFVFINMVKHKEGSRLAEGPIVEEITPDGVVLSQNGKTFLLPRD